MASTHNQNRNISHPLASMTFWEDNTRIGPLIDITPSFVIYASSRSDHPEGLKERLGVYCIPGRPSPYETGKIMERTTRHSATEKVAAFRAVEDKDLLAILTVDDRQGGNNRKRVARLNFMLLRYDTPHPSAIRTGYRLSVRCPTKICTSQVEILDDRVAVLLSSHHRRSTVAIFNFTTSEKIFEIAQDSANSCSFVDHQYLLITNLAERRVELWDTSIYDRICFELPPLVPGTHLADLTCSPNYLRYSSDYAPRYYVTFTMGMYAPLHNPDLGPCPPDVKMVYKSVAFVVPFDFFKSYARPWVELERERTMPYRTWAGSEDRICWFPNTNAFPKCNAGGSYFASLSNHPDLPRSLVLSRFSTCRDVWNFQPELYQSQQSWVDGAPLWPFMIPLYSTMPFEEVAEISRIEGATRAIVLEGRVFVYFPGQRPQLTMFEIQSEQPSHYNLYL